MIYGFLGRMAVGGGLRIIVVVALTLSCQAQVFPAQASDPQLAAVSSEQQSGEQASHRQISGSISGTIIDQSGAVLPGAQVRLTAGEAINHPQQVLTDDKGQFTFAGVSPGSFELTITSAGFAAQTFSGVLHAGEIQQLSPIMLNIAEARTTVQAVLPQAEVAEEQMRVEEKQRVLGIVPDFYISYVPNAAPLNARQKFNLAWKSAIDPFTFVVAGGIAGIQQAQNHFSAYGQELGGYAKRFGAGYADTVTATFIADAALASLFKQDPRYFYKGTGSKQSRALYAIANAVICKGDNGHWQPNYSRVLGHLAAAGASNLYYPANDRNNAALTFENAAIGIGGSAVANLLQEFLARRFTPKAAKQDPGIP